MKKKLKVTIGVVAATLGFTAAGVVPAMAGTNHGCQPQWVNVYNNKGECFGYAVKKTNKNINRIGITAITTGAERAAEFRYQTYFYRIDGSRQWSKERTIRMLPNSRWQTPEAVEQGGKLHLVYAKLINLKVS